jgi:hypothetical protein
MDLSETELRRQFGKDFDEHIYQSTEGVTFKLSRLQAWQLCGTIQLASRHPQAKDSPSIQASVAIAKDIACALAITESLKEVMNRGWNPQYDERM